MGLLWPQVVSATEAYLHDKSSPKPHASEAYAAKIHAELEMKDRFSAIRDADAMLDTVAYTPMVADATSELINYLELLYTAEAVKVATKRQELILGSLRSSATTNGSTGPPAGLTRTELYLQGVALAKLQQLDADPDVAEKTVSILDRALPSDISSDDLISIKGIRDQYMQWGQPLGRIDTLRRLTSHKMTIPAIGNITVLLVFPDWCAQGIRLAQNMPGTPFEVEGSKGYLYALLAETVPPQALPHALSSTTLGHGSLFNPAFAAEYLKGTPTAIVPADLLREFNASDVPLLIVVDKRGIVRLIEVADETILQPGNTVDSAVAIIGKRWPVNYADNGGREH